MKPLPPFSIGTLLLLLVVLASAAGARAWYLAACTENGQRDAALLVQGLPPRSHLPEGAELRGRPAKTQLDNLVGNLATDRWFGCLTPLFDAEEDTAQEAPLYPLLCGAIASVNGDWADTILRWLQCVLGSLTAGCYFFFARRAFHHTMVATIAGLLAALHPFWVINTAELNDGVLATFLVGMSLALGARGGQVGGAFTGLAFGLALAGVALTRAALLPFTAIALLWFLWECRRFPLGWFAGFLALMGFANGLAPWLIRDYLVFERPVPVATSTYLHLWMGNNPHEPILAPERDALRRTFSEERWNELLAERNQAKRYNSLAQDVWQEVKERPAATLSRRLQAGLVFLLGDRWFKQTQLAQVQAQGDAIAEPPVWLRDHVETILQGTLLGIFALALLGWRWSYSWRRYGGIGAIAMLLIPLPYVISHAEILSGPRLPLDGVLLCYAAFALVNLIPGLVGTPKAARNAQAPNA